MISPYVDIISIIIYSFLGLYFFATFRFACKNKKSKETKILLLCLFFSIVPTIIAVYRKVDYPIGGRDAQSYINEFLNISLSNYSVLDALTFKTDNSPLFDLIAYGTRMLTSNYHVYFWLIYLFINFSIFYFVIETFEKNDFFSPLIYVIYYFLMSFNIVRFMFAMSFVAIGFVCISKNKNIFGLVLFLLAALSHTSLIIMIPITVFYLIIKKVKKISPFIIVSLIVVLNIVLLLAKNYLLNFLSESTYSSYVDYSSNLMSSLTSIVCGVLTLFFFNSFKEDKSVNRFMLYCVIVDMALIPFTMYINFFRLHIIFVLPRLYVFSKLFTIRLPRLNNKTIGFSSLATCAFLAWTIFRFARDWNNAALMPYIFELF